MYLFIIFFSLLLLVKPKKIQKNIKIIFLQITRPFTQLRADHQMRLSLNPRYESLVKKRPNYLANSHLIGCIIVIVERIRLSDQLVSEIQSGQILALFFQFKLHLRLISSIFCLVVVGSLCSLVRFLCTIQPSPQHSDCEF